MCKEVLNRLSGTGRYYVTDLVLLTFAVTTALERLPALAQLAFMATIVIALSELGASVSRGALDYLARGSKRGQALLAGSAFLLVHFAGGATEGLNALPRGATMEIAAQTGVVAVTLAALQWFLPFVYAALLLRWLSPGFGRLVDRIRG